MLFIACNWNAEDQWTKSISSFDLCVCVCVAFVLLTSLIRFACVFLFQIFLRKSGRKWRPQMAGIRLSCVTIGIIILCIWFRPQMVLRISIRQRYGTQACPIHSFNYTDSVEMQSRHLSTQTRSNKAISSIRCHSNRTMHCVYSWMFFAYVYISLIEHALIQLSTTKRVVNLFFRFLHRNTLVAQKVWNWPENWTINRQPPGLVTHISMSLIIPPILKPKSIACLNACVKSWASIPATVCYEHHVNSNFWVRVFFAHKQKTAHSLARTLCKSFYSCASALVSNVKFVGFSHAPQSNILFIKISGYHLNRLSVWMNANIAAVMASKTKQKHKHCVLFDRTFCSSHTNFSSAFSLSTQFALRFVKIYENLLNRELRKTKWIGPNCSCLA